MLTAVSARTPPIEYPPDPDQAGRPVCPGLVEFVGGPRDGERERLSHTPALIDTGRGTYRQSVRCADDGALRYVFDENPIQIAHERWIRPC
jgi:hypothetical protein